MRTTVGDLVKELSECDQKSFVTVQTNHYDGSQHSTHHGEYNGILRVDKLLNKTTLVIQREA